MKKFAILMSILMFVTVAVAISPVMAKQAQKLVAMRGVVTQIDDQAGSITVKSGKKEATLKAEPKLLEGITVGEKVIIEKAGDTVKSIKKTPGAHAKAKGHVPAAKVRVPAAPTENPPAPAAPTENAPAPAENAK